MHTNTNANNKSNDHHIHVVGAGGIGSWLIPQLVLMHEASRITVHDGDKFELKNLARQLFDPTAVNLNKADFMARKYGVTSSPRYLTPGMLEDLAPEDFVIVCADNNPARVMGLELVDQFGCYCIVAANEYTDAEAYVYLDSMDKGTPRDPRTYYPNLLTDHSGDPTGPGCTGDASDERPQLVLANSIAAVHALHLWHYYTRGHAGPEWGPAWPVHHRTTFAGTRTIKRGDLS